ncbi:glycoside hydrolase N-terminal domain-containing protein, partial [Pseudomonas sp. 2995-1]|uniref:glycoside hydrolase N-terminal domain-containing protein n=1 Tax=Pseudomonas sp. 2995-1 TaxID=1712679 RepID=UPI00211492E8
MHYDRGNTRNLDDMEAISDDCLVMRGETGGKNGIEFRSAIKAIADNGHTETLGNRIIVTDADAVTIILSAATSYRYKHPEEQCLKTINDATEITYTTLLDTHIKDYQSLFHRVDLQLGELNEENDKWKLPTDKRLKLLQGGEEDTSL